MSEKAEFCGLWRICIFRNERKSLSISSSICSFSYSYLASSQDESPLWSFELSDDKSTARSPSSQAPSFNKAVSFPLPSFPISPSPLSLIHSISTLLLLFFEQLPTACIDSPFWFSKSPRYPLVLILYIFIYKLFKIVCFTQKVQTYSHERSRYVLSMHAFQGM